MRAFSLLAAATTTTTLCTLSSALPTSTSRRFMMMTTAAAASSTSASSAALKAHVTTYNVLSSHLAAPDYFTACDPEHLHPTFRYKSLLNKLDAQVSQGSVICLQELSLQWAGRLHAYFSAKGYYMTTGLYGNKFNGYMGVGVAVPLAAFEIVDCDMTRVADTMTPYRRPAPSLLTKLLKLLLDPLLRFARQFGWFKKAFDPWADAERRFNQLVSVRLRCRATDRQLVVGTYHMPCMFRSPPVMSIHCALAAQHIQRLAGDLPYLLVGDFNVKPDSSMYRLLTEGTLPSTGTGTGTGTVEEAAQPPPREGDSWRAVAKPMRSAYKEANKHEPELTNFAQSKGEEPFIGCLDYIFMSPHWAVKAVEPLPARAALSGPMPLADQPSDHLLLAAALEC